METFWGLYITIALGLLAFLGTVKPSPKEIVLAIILSMGFIGFACANGEALRNVTYARNVTKELICAYKDKDPAKQSIVEQIKTTVRPPTVAELTIFQVVFDIGVLVGIWILTLYEKTPRQRKT